MKSIYRIEDASYKTDLVKWVRSDFKTNKDLKDEVCYLFQLMPFFNKK